MFKLVALLINLGQLSREHPIKYGSERARSLLIAHHLDLSPMLLRPIALLRNIVRQIARQLIDKVLLLAPLSAARTTSSGRLTTGSFPIGCVFQVRVENVPDVLVLREQYDAHVQAAEHQAHEQALDVDPEHLSAVPGVPQVVDGGGDGWNVDERDLEERVPIDSLVVLHPILEASQELLAAEKTAVLKPEELEGGEHAPVQDPTLGSPVSDAVLLVERVFTIDETLLDERVENAVDDVVEDEGECDQDWAATVSVLPHENNLIDPEADHPASL